MKRFFSAVASVLICAALIVVVGLIVYQGGYLDKFLSDNSFLNPENVASTLLKHTSSEKQAIKDGTLATQKIEIDSKAAGDVRVPVTQKVAAPGSYGYLAQQSGLSDMKTVQMQKLYHALVQNSYSVTQQKNDKGYYNVAQTVVKNATLDERNIRIAITAFKNDNPQIFWIANVYSYTYQGNDTVVQLYSYIPANECNQMVAQLNAKVSKIVVALPKNLSEFNRELMLYDTMAKSCIYDDAAAANSELWQAYTAYGTLVDGKAVCEGYSRAMQLLLSYANMQCRLVNGEGQNTLHMWNLVYVSNAWYHLDATWNDDDQIESHDYFNLSDAAILADHEISPQVSSLTNDEINGKNGSQHVSYNLSLPACKSNEQNYYRVKGIPIQSFTASADKNVVSALAAAAKRHDKYVSFFIGDTMDYEDAIDKLFHNSPYKYLYYVKAANKLAGDKNHIQYNQTVFFEAKASRGVTLKLSYE